MVGRLLSCDEQTFCCRRLDYARVYVEIDVTLPFTHGFDIITPLSKELLHIEVKFDGNLQDAQAMCSNND
uniref:Uncharacterized protein n=1 Tax=Salix viminalis TaxID=40686 RepID=A0A6N2L1H6_SALVM